MSKIKTFTVHQAQELLPVLKSLMRRAMEAKKVLDRMEKELQDLKHRVLLSGGLFVDVGAVSRRHAERQRVTQEAKDALGEIHAIGVQVKDLDLGLLDFPCAVEQGTVLLCWKYGEERIQFWHGIDEGFRGRKPIDERILRGKRKKEKPN